jgi:hypothetical protein
MRLYSPRAFDSQRSVVEPQGLKVMVFYTRRTLAERAFLIGSTVLSNEPNSHRRFTSIAPGAFDSQGSVV